MNRANTGFDFQWLGTVLEHSALVEDFMPGVQTFMHDKESWSQSDWVRFSWVFVLLSSNSYLLTLLRMAKNWLEINSKSAKLVQFIWNQLDYQTTNDVPDLAEYCLDAKLFQLNIKNRSRNELNAIHSKSESALNP